MRLLKLLNCGRSAMFRSRAREDSAHVGYRVSFGCRTAQEVRTCARTARAYVFIAANITDQKLTKQT